MLTEKEIITGRSLPPVGPDCESYLVGGSVYTIDRVPGDPEPLITDRKATKQDYIDAGVLKPIPSVDEEAARWENAILAYQEKWEQ